MIRSYEIQIETPRGRSIFMIVASTNAEQAALTARDMLEEMREYDRKEMDRAVRKESSVWVVNAIREHQVELT